MTTTQFDEPNPDTIIQDLHRIREAIVDSFGGDLHKLTADARERQNRSGRVILRRKEAHPKFERTSESEATNACNLSAAGDSS
jgi:hypothetical protein